MIESLIVGWGHTKFGRHDALSPEDLIHMASREALESAGIAPPEEDAVWLGHFNSGLVPDGFCSSMILGADSALRFKSATRVENACASGSAALYAAISGFF